MIKVPRHLELGQHFYNEDGAYDVGIYQVRELKKGDGSRTHLYIKSVPNVEEAKETVRRLNSDLETKSKEDN